MPCAFTSPAVHVRVGTVDEVPASAWRPLIGPTGFYCDLPWLRSLRLAHGTGEVLLAVRHGRVVAAVPTWDGDPTDDDLFALPRLAGGLPGPWQQPFLWLGGRRVTANTLPCHADDETRVRVLGDILTSARARASARGRAGLVWPYLPAATARELAAAHPAARVVLHSADAVLAVPADGMAGLSAAAPRRDRRNWRRELQAFERHNGTSVEWHPLSEAVADEAAALIAAKRAKYGAVHDTDSLRAALTAQRTAGVADDAVVCLARAGPRVVAAAVFYRYGRRLFGRYWGAAPDAPPFAYFVLTVYAAVDWAAHHGFTHLHLSVAAWEAKAARGAVLHPLAMVVAPAFGQPPWFTESAAHDHNARFAASWRSRFATRPNALATAWDDWPQTTGPARPAPDQAPALESPKDSPP